MKGFGISILPTIGYQNFLLQGLWESEIYIKIYRNHEIGHL